MPRKARDERLDTRAARLRLPVRREPYFRTIQEGRAIGYRRIGGGRAGTWVARHFDPTRDPTRLYRALGAADDMLEADGVDTLTFAQAQTAAAAWFAELSRSHARAPAQVTVQAIMADYATDYAARGGKDVRGLEIATSAHITPKLGNKLVKDLTPGVIRSWHRHLATTPARVRATEGKTATRALDATDADATRARRATANRVLTVLKAALNLAYRDGKISTDDAWRRVTPFRNADAPRIRYLTDTEAVRLVNAADPAFRPMISAALLTGCRYGEICRLRANDFDPAAATLHVRLTKSGKPRSIMLNAEGVAFFHQHVAGKRGTALIFTKPEGEPWGPSHQSRPIAAACAAANIGPAISFHILRHTHATRLIMAGSPLGVAAAQLGNSEAICAKHYAHLSPGFVAESIRAASGPLGIVEKTNVTPMTG